MIVILCMDWFLRHHSTTQSANSQHIITKRLLVSRGWSGYIIPYARTIRSILSRALLYNFDLCLYGAFSDGDQYHSWTRVVPIRNMPVTSKPISKSMKLAFHLSFYGKFEIPLKLDETRMKLRNFNLLETSKNLLKLVETCLNVNLETFHELLVQLKLPWNIHKTLLYRLSHRQKIYRWPR